jgi:hypothetical protein
MSIAMLIILNACGAHQTQEEVMQVWLLLM